MAEPPQIFIREVSATVRTAQVLGLTSTAFLCGKTFSQSFSTTPALLLAPAPLLARQWKKMFDSDKLLGPAMVLVSSGIFGYLAYREPTFKTTPSILYTSAASLLLTIIPYSYLVLEPINQKLESKAEEFRDVVATEADAEIGVKQEETVHVLVDRWATVNLGRMALSGVASILAAWAAVEKLQIGAIRVVEQAQ